MTFLLWWWSEGVGYYISLRVTSRSLLASVTLRFCCQCNILTSTSFKMHYHWKRWPTRRQNVGENKTDNSIIITTLFQEDNKVSTNAILTYGPQIQRHTYMRLIITERNENYLQYVQSRWGLRTPSMLWAGYPTLLALKRGVGTIYPGTRPADVREW